MRAVFEVTGTTVMTPRLSRVAVALAASLLTTTAGRLLLASEPRAGSRLTVTISPRRIQLPRPSAVTASQALAYRPRAVADAAGTFVVAWSDTTAGTLNLLTSPPGGSFGPATTFSAGTLGDIKIAPGHAVVTFGTAVSSEPVS